MSFSSAITQPIRIELAVDLRQRDFRGRAATFGSCEVRVGPSFGTTAPEGSRGGDG
jgi:hypothetical protein